MPSGSGTAYPAACSTSMFHRFSCISEDLKLSRILVPQEALWSVPICIVGSGSGLIPLLPMDAHSIYTTTPEVGELGADL